MPSIDLTESQAERLESVRAELESAIAGKYATVRTVDAVEYLLDTYTPPEESAVSPDASADATATSDEPEDIVADAVGASAESSAEPSEPAETDEEESASAASSKKESSGAGSGGGPNRLKAMMNLLKTHDDKWTKSSGDAPYEVTLPDGGTKPARTKDDVRRLLFKHYR